MADGVVPRVQQRQGGEKVRRDSGSWHQQVCIPMGEKLVKSAGVYRGCVDHCFVSGEKFLVCQ